MCPRWCRVPSSVSRLRPHRSCNAGLFVLATFATCLIPAMAWNPPPTQEYRGQPTVNGKPAGGQMLSYFADQAWVDLYSPKGHGYIIQHAIEMLRADGYENWADVAQANHLHLLSGAAHADNYMGRIRAYFQLDVLWGLFSVDLYEYDITCRAGCDHYHNVSDGAGLKMPVEAALSRIVDWLIFRYLLDFGLASIDVDIVPELDPQYPSAVSLCQKHFDAAQGIWRDGAFIYPSRSAIESAFYELGWACHLLADQAVVQHQHNEFFGGHSSYEDFADGRGSALQYARYHPRSAAPFGAYKHDPKTPGGPWRAYDYARTVAERIYSEPGHHALAEDGGPTERDQALQFAIPLAEAYTAGLIARFMSETGVPAKSPPLSGYVRADKGEPVPGAYVFYADAGSTIKIEQNMPDPNPVDRWKSWDMVRADSGGRYRIPVKPDNYYLLRAARPGYGFEGKTSANLEFGDRKCPVVYYQQRGMYSANTLDLFLKPLPISNVAVLAQGNRSRRPPMRAATLTANVSLPRSDFVIRPGMRLSVSGSEVSPELAQCIERAVMSVSTQDSVLGAEGGGTKLPETSVIDIQLSRLVEMATAAVVWTPDQVTRALDRHLTDRVKAAKMRNTRAARAERLGLQTLSTGQLAQLKSLLPSRQATVARGQRRTVYTLQGPEDMPAVTSHLDVSGLLVVPGMPGAVIEVSAVPGSEYLSGGVTPVQLVSDKAGRARVGIQAGSHAGVLRLRFRIVSAPDGMLPGAEQIVNLLVQPRVVGPDPAVPRPPTLGPPAIEVHMIQGTIISPSTNPTVAPRPGRTAKPVDAQPTLRVPEPEPAKPPARRTPAPKLERR